MFTSDKTFVRTFLLSLAAVTLLCGCAGAAGGELAAVKYYSVVPADGDSKADCRWADYLTGQMLRRSSDADVLDYGSAPPDSCLEVRLHIDASLPCGYRMKRDGRRLSLTARDADRMLWLVYQFISGCGDSRIAVGDLPPACLPPEGGEGDFAFEYRGIYSPSNSDPELMPITATHNVDYDWALWGHNLRRVFGGDVPPEALARDGGRVMKEQLCFSSAALYSAVEAYVIDCGGDSPEAGTLRFAIMPDDNKTVCLCRQCRRAGNTASSATPAVTAILRRLAERFPHSLFFTSSYHTTAQPPSGRMPANTGVLVSAITLPMRTRLDGTREADAFAALVRRWKAVTDRVYVWDYMRNYDDYFTPYPCLRAVSERLSMYRGLGVRGVFYNGSSPYYSSFDDVQTAAIAAMMACPGVDVMAYADSCFSRYYRVTATLLASAYRSWEDTVAARRATLPFYSGISGAVAAWLSPSAYTAYCDTLDRRAKSAGEAERARLNRLLTATWLTRLELLKACGGADADRAEAARCLDGLKGCKAFKDMTDYKETDGSLDKYIKGWEKANH